MDASLHAAIQGVGEDSVDDLEQLAQSLRDRGRRDQSIAVYDRIFSLDEPGSPVAKVKMLRVRYPHEIVLYCGSTV
jgi:7-keto-8-aminopelargonate synthetase-like enzyme